MRHFLLYSSIVLASTPVVRAADEPDWVKPMKAVRAKFTGQPGTLALFGDSITVSKAFWQPLRYLPQDAPPEVAQPVAIVKKHLLEDCWGKWRGPEFGNAGGQTTQWAEENVANWLKKLNPECAVILFGTNDLTRTETKTYEKQLRSLVEKCLNNGTVVILTTIPPRAGEEVKAKAFADAARRIATDLKIPLIDYQAEILKRRPDDWDGSKPQFRGQTDVYQVPTLVSGDGVHPSNPSKYQDYSANSLNCNGYQLRNVLTARAYADVIQFVLASAKK